MVVRWVAPMVVRSVVRLVAQSVQLSHIKHHNVLKPCSSNPEVVVDLSGVDWVVLQVAHSVVQLVARLVADSVVQLVDHLVLPSATRLDVR